MDIQTALKKARTLLHTTPTARLDSELLLEATMHVSRSVLYTWPNRHLTEKESNDFLQKIQRRQQGEPIAYILEEKEFWSFPFKVNRATLIPRPETELLVEKAMEIIPIDAQWKILELGTGSGAIALALAHERPQCEILATDISADALMIARENARELQLLDVNFLESDWFAKIESCFELIISNPPYVAAKDPHLDANELQCEPIGALASGHDGLDAIREIIRCSDKFLTKKGVLILEHGYDQQTSVIKLLNQADFLEINGYTDLNDKPRCSQD